MRILLLAIALLLSAQTGWTTTLTLEQCLRFAQQNNPDLRSAKITPLIAQHQVKVARSHFLPRVDINAGYSMLANPQAVVIGGRSEVTQEAEFPFYDLKVVQTLYDFGQTGNQVEGARINAEAARYDFKEQVQEVFLTTVAAYYRILEAQNILFAVNEEVFQLKDHLRVARNFFDQGMVTRNDVLLAEVELANSLQRQLQRKNELENAWLQLNYLTGRPAEARGDLEEDAVIVSLPELDAQRAIVDRPAVQADRLRLSASQASVSESRSAFRPTLFAQAEMNYLDNQYVSEQTMYSATIGIRFNLFDGYASTARLNSAIEAEQQTRERLQSLERQTMLAVRTADNDARVAAARISVAEESVAQAEENLRINKERYLSQVGTSTDVIDAQTILTRSRTQIYQARFDYQLAKARLRRAAGRLGEDL